MNSERVNVLFREDENSEWCVLYDDFPVAIATTFSNMWKAEVSARHERKVSRVGLSPPKKALTIENGRNADTYKTILGWMLACCNGTGLKQYPNPSHRHLTQAYLIRCCANHIGCEYLVKLTTERMESICSGQISAEDVRALWLVTPPDPAMKKFLAEEVAERLWVKSLRSKASFWHLREELPDFNMAIKELLDAKGAASRAEREKRKAERQSQQRAGGNFTGSCRQHVRNDYQQQQDAAEPEVVEQMVGPVEEITVIKAPVVRKGRNGRPTYAKVDLAAIGVTREQFSAQD